MQGLEKLLADWLQPVTEQSLIIFVYRRSILYESVCPWRLLGIFP